MGSAGNRTSNSIERREREKESSLENTLPLSADAVKTWPTSLSRWLAGSECILELENKKGWLAKLVAKSVTRARYSITLSSSNCKSLYEIFRERNVSFKTDSSFSICHRYDWEKFGRNQRIFFFPFELRETRVLKKTRLVTRTLMSFSARETTPFLWWREENRRRKSDTREAKGKLVDS